MSDTKHIERGVEEKPLFIDGRAKIRVWSVSTLKKAVPLWSELPREEREEMLDNPSTFPVSPDREIEAGNMVLDNFLEGLAEGVYHQPSHLAIGTGSDPPTSTNEQLNNEVYRTPVGQDDSDGRDRLLSTFISQNEMNGLALREVGLANGRLDEEWLQLTHLVLPEADRIATKTSNETVTIDYTLLFRRVG